MDKKLLLEIKRFKEILELPLLTEGIPGAIGDIFNKFFSTTTDAVSQLGKVAREAEIDSKVVDDFIRVLNEPDLYDELKLIDKRNIIRLLSYVPGLSDELFQNLLKTFDTNIDELNLAVYNLMNRSENPLSYRQTLNKLFSEAPELTPLIMAKHGKQFGDFKPPSRTSSPSKDVIKKLTLTPGEIEQFNKVVQSKTVNTFAGDIIKYWKQDVNDIKNDIIAYSEGFLEEIKGLKKNKEIPQPLIDAYSVQISRLLDRAEIKMNGAAAKILEDAGLDNNLVRKIKFGNEPFFVTYQKIRGKDNQKLYEIMAETSKEFLVEIIDLIKGIFRKEANTIIRMFNPKTSIGQWFYTNQWASLNKLYRLAIKMSPGESKTKQLTYISATMFASSIGFVFGSLLKAGFEGLIQLYGGGALNYIFDKVGGEDGLFFGKNIEKWKVELPKPGIMTDSLLKAFGRPLDAIGDVIYKDVYKSFEEKGIPDVVLRLAPGGLLTYPESLAVKLFEYVTPGEDKVLNFRDILLSLVGMNSKGDNRAETTTQLQYTLDETLPQDLINVMPDSKVNELVIQGGEIYWGRPEYKVEKNPQNNNWEVLIPNKGWYKIDKTLTEQSNVHSMKRKGLSILLEQPDVTGKTPTRPTPADNSQDGQQQSQQQTPQRPVDRSNQEQKRKTELENAMMAMFEKFNVQDRDSERNLIDKLTTRDKELIVKDCFDALISKYNGILNIDNNIVDDTVVENTVLYLINDRKMDPFKITYKTPLVLNAKIMESKGLEKILFEQGVRVDYNTIYINYTNSSSRNDDKFELIRGGKAERTALDNYNKRTGQKNIEDKPVTPKPTPRPLQTSEPRPEETMEIETPKMMKKQLNNEKS